MNAYFYETVGKSFAFVPTFGMLMIFAYAAMSFVLMYFKERKCWLFGVFAVSTIALILVFFWLTTTAY